MPTSAYIKKSRAASRPAPLSHEEQIAQKALDVTTEVTSLTTVLSTLQHADLSIEQSIVKFRNDVIKPGIAEVHQAFDEIVSTAKTNLDTAKINHNVARSKLDEYLAPWEKADQLLRDTLNGYYSRMKEIQRREQELADREQAERERLAAIQRDQERIKLEKDIQKQIDSLPKKANPALIDKLLEPLEEFDAPQVIAPPVRVSQPELSGAMSQTDNWKGEVMAGREMEVLRLVVDGTLPISIIEFRAPELNKLAKLYKNTKRVAGLRFWNQPFVRGVGRQ